MTREEAISVLERVAHTESKWPGTEATLEALDMAISALRAQQEHTCPCDLCNFGPPSSMRGKPCTMCPAVPRQERNDPLTLDELRKMDGEPVWTVTIGLSGSGRWELCTCETVCACPLHKVIRCVTADGEATDYDFDTYGKTWLAYRQKPEEGTI